MNVQVTRDGADIQIWFQTDLPNKEGNCSHFLLAKRCSMPWIAELLVRHLNGMIRQSVEQTRRKEYMRGWADAKAKRVKNNSFVDWLE